MIPIQNIRTVYIEITRTTYISQLPISLDKQLPKNKKMPWNVGSTALTVMKNVIWPPSVERTLMHTPNISSKPQRNSQGKQRIAEEYGPLEAIAWNVHHQRSRHGQCKRPSAMHQKSTSPLVATPEVYGLL